MQEPLNSLENFQEYVGRNLALILSIVAIAGAFSGMYGLVVYRKSRAQQAAYRAFVQLKKMVDAAVHDPNDDKQHDHVCFPSEEAKWDAVATTAQIEFGKHSGSSFGAHLVVFKVNALLRQQKQEEALACLTKHLDALPHSVIKEQLLAQKALMMVDSADSSISQAGLKELEKIAHADGVAADFAYYWLGAYHWANGNVQEAKVVWTTLIAESNKIIQGQAINNSELVNGKSPWIRKAKKILKTLQ